VAITEEDLLEDNVKTVPYKMDLDYGGVGIKAEHEAGYEELDYGGGKKLVILDKDITYIPLVYNGVIYAWEALLRAYLEPDPAG